jgi:hypothetical protein
MSKKSVTVHCVSITKTSVIASWEIIEVYSEKPYETMNTLCGQNTEILNVATCTYINPLSTEFLLNNI